VWSGTYYRRPAPAPITPSHHQFLTLPVRAGGWTARLSTCFTARVEPARRHGSRSAARRRADRPRPRPGFTAECVPNVFDRFYRATRGERPRRIGPGRRRRRWPPVRQRLRRAGAPDHARRRRPDVQRRRRLLRRPVRRRVRRRSARRRLTPGVLDVRRRRQRRPHERARARPRRQRQDHRLHRSSDFPTTANPAQRTFGGGKGTGRSRRCPPTRSPPHWTRPVAPGVLDLPRRLGRRHRQPDEPRRRRQPPAPSSDGSGASAARRPGPRRAQGRGGARRGSSARRPR
jgi:hypothetical protein